MADEQEPGLAMRPEDLSDERDSADILATDYYMPPLPLRTHRLRVSPPRVPEVQEASPPNISSSEESDTSFQIARRMAGQEPYVFTIDNSGIVLPDIDQGLGPAISSGPSGVDRVGESSSMAPSPNPAWTAAFYNTHADESRDVSDFNAYQQSDIPASDLLSALSYAAHCHAHELGEYNLTLHNAKEIGMRPVTHFDLANYGPWGPVHVGEVNEWLEKGEIQRRRLLVKVVLEIRLLRAARLRIGGLILETEERWKREGMEHDREIARVRDEEAVREDERKKGERCCAVM